MKTPASGCSTSARRAIKGSETIKRAGELLRAAAAAGQINFHGNVEGNDIFKGTTDLVVCDGFVGNVALKTSEGLAGMLTQMIREEFSRTPLTRLAALVALPVLKRIQVACRPPALQWCAPCSACVAWCSRAHGSSDAYAFGRALEPGV
jgi:glycerol-3-phosphate acyltransferase PlsX